MAVDIVKDYSWTSIPKGSGYREEAPCAFVRAYELEHSQLQQFVSGYVNLGVAVGADARQSAQEALSKVNIFGFSPVKKPPPKTPFKPMDFYKNLYQSNKPIESYNFPFFGDNIRGFNNAYDDVFSSISQRGGKFMGAGLIDKFTPLAEEVGFGSAAGFNEVKNVFSQAKEGWNAAKEKNPDAGFGESLAGGLKGMGQFVAKEPGSRAPGSYIETPKMYQYDMTDAPLAINFVLANTIDEGDMGNNTEFIRKFTAINRPRREGPVAITFPAIYHVEVPGLRYIEWAYLSNFSIGLLGTRRKINNQVIPEAYSCNFEFTSLTIEAANFMDELDNTGGGDFDLFAEDGDTRGFSELSEAEQEALVPDFGTERYYELNPGERPSGETVPTRAPRVRPAAGPDTDAFNPDVPYTRTDQ